MTCPLMDDVTLEDWDFHVDCEVNGCTRAAVVSAKGCADKRHFLRCNPCYAAELQRLQGFVGFMCNHCHRPILDPSTHLNEIWL